ncbi:hypothetical protein R1flu_017220 [Riccia fluitans]|uniref:Uncharacterized protein n=1 Tax=Riccia fluitans TaxID=41844 RepID=A0ABD1XDP5_9MARC
MGEEPRTGKSSIEEVANAGGGKESQRHEESNGENLDVTNKSPLDELAVKVISILGPAGAGLLAVRDVPGVAELRA